MIRRDSSAVSRHERSVGIISEDSPSPEEQYAEIIDNFHSFDRSNPITPRSKTRKSLLRTDNNQANLLISSLSSCQDSKPMSDDLSRHQHRHSRTKSVLSKSTAVTSSLSTEGDDSSPLSESKSSMEEGNVEPSNENKQLKQREVPPAVGRNSPAKDSNINGGSDGGVDKVAERNGAQAHILKLTEKAKTLKLQYKDERRKAMRLEKQLHADNVEIEGLRRELSNALDTIDSLEQDQTSDRQQLLRLTTELEEWRRNDGKTPSVKRLEAQLRERNDELSMTLEMLETKAKRIVQLENELYQAERKIGDYEQREIRQNNSFQESQVSQSASAFPSVDLENSRAECKRLRRQNVMLKLLLEEMEESHKGKEKGDLDSLYGKSAAELGVVLSARDEPVNVSSLTSQGHGPSPRNCSACPSPANDPFSSDASSARAEALFQQEIERFNLEESSSSRSDKSKQSTRKYLSDEWMHPYNK